MSAMLRGVRAWSSSRAVPTGVVALAAIGPSWAGYIAETGHHFRADVKSMKVIRSEADAPSPAKNGP